MNGALATTRRRFLSRALAALGATTWLGGGPRRADAQTSDQPYVGEVKMLAGDVAPAGWMFCEGQVLDISTYSTLFYLIGTTYGGDGQSTFALPDLRGRAPVHMGTGAGSSYVIGQVGGAETASLSTSQLPAHTHSAKASLAAGTSASPAGMVPALDASGSPHYGTGTDAVLSGAAMSSVGGSGAHDNMQPYLTLRFIISLDGVYPSTT
jgi:microcystin-dependent protein